MRKNWEPKTLGEIASLRRETVDPRNAIGLRYVGLEHINPGEVLIDRWGDPTKVKSLKSHFYTNDILYGKLRPYLDKAVLAKDEGIASTDILIITPNKADPSFLVYLLHSNRFLSYAKATMSGVNHPRTSWSALSKFELEVPPQREQSAIARLLSVVQAAKAARQREIELERERKAALIACLFTYGIRSEETTHSEIGKIPVSWEVAQLSSIVRETVKDGTHSTPSYIADGLPFITTKDIVDNRISFENCAYISREEHNKLKKRAFPEAEDILLTKVGSVGNVAIVDTDLEFSIFVQLALIKPDFDKVYPKFLMYALQSEKCQQEIYKKSSQSTMRFIGTQKISTIRIPLPALPEQHEITSVLQACDAKIRVLKNEIRLLNELFAALLEKLMTGKLDVTPLKEVAQA